MQAPSKSWSSVAAAAWVPGRSTPATKGGFNLVQSGCNVASPFTPIIHAWVLAESMHA